MKFFRNKEYRLHRLNRAGQLAVVKVVFSLWISLFASNLLAQIKVGAEDTLRYLPLLQGKNIAVVVNPSSLIGGEHLLDFLRSKDIQVKKILALEHGIYGKADAGAKISDGIDSHSGLPVKSLYGNSKQPKQEDLVGIDMVLFDIQDVGARFYTYISSLHYIMKSCAEFDVELLVLDRPNPNGHIVDGPILESNCKSFVGMHPVPVLHGMTIGEYALMINGENWIEEPEACSLTIISCKNYKRDMAYNLPVPPSPNLPNAQSVFLYPHLCFFEGTVVSVGRGTDFPFQVYGAPNQKEGTFTFIPKPSAGASRPKHNGKVCRGEDLRELPLNSFESLRLDWLVKAYHNSGKPAEFFSGFFKLLAGTKQLQKQIEKGMSANEISESWKTGLDEFKSIRSKYLLYP